MTEETKQELVRVGATPSPKSMHVLTVKGYLSFLDYIRKTYDRLVRVYEIPALANELSLYPTPASLYFSTTRHKNVKIEYEDPEYDMVLHFPNIINYLS